MGLVIVKDGIFYAAGLAIAAAVVWWLAGAWCAPLWLLAVFCLYFFRDPDRAIPSGPVAVAPAEGAHEPRPRRGLRYRAARSVY